MLNDFRLTLAAFNEPVAWRVLGFGLTLAAGLLVLLAFGAVWLIMATEIFPWAEWRGMAGGFAFIFVLFLGWFIFPLLFSASAGLFTEYLADAIETRHYPGLPPARHIGLPEQLTTGLRFMRRSFAGNLLALPFYLLPGFNFIIFVLFNARNMAYEYFMTVALRRYTSAAAEEMFRLHYNTLWRTGAFIALLFVLPGVNLIAPVLATSLMTHRHAHLNMSPLTSSKNVVTRI